MPRKLTQEEFLSKARAVHGDRYDYSQAVYSGSAGKLQIGCPKHGVFEQSPNSHIGCKACGCPKCKGETLAAINGLGQSAFIKKAQVMHGSKYDYSQVLYVRGKDRIKIGCPEHGFFEQSAHSHATGAGCPRCGTKRGGIAISDNTETFVAKASTRHGNRYDYSQVLYEGSTTKVKIGCPIHGSFKMRPVSHIVGQGCPQCWEDRRGDSIMHTIADFVETACAVHGGKYDYSQVVYEGSKKPVLIGCPEHGYSKQKPNSHLMSDGCAACGIARRAASHLHDSEIFISQARAVHGETYDYSQVIYIRSSKNVLINCAAHGQFSQTPNAHLRGSGCPICYDEKRRLGWIAQATGRVCTLYFLRIFGNGESFFKVGITYTSIKRRYAGKRMLNGYRYEIFAKHQSINAAAIYDWEQAILQTFTHIQYQPKLIFGGATECFSSCEEILAIFPL